jgi:hypothetical protein
VAPLGQRTSKSVTCDLNAVKHLIRWNFASRAEIIGRAFPVPVGGRPVFI